MAILVTGGAGYIGSHMLLELLDAGENVTVIDNLSTGFRGAVPDGAKLVMGDVGDARILTQIFAENVLEVIETVRRVSGVQFPVREGPRRPGDPAALVAGANRARQVLDWHPELDVFTCAGLGKASYGL